MAARRHRNVYDVKETEKMVPLITGEVAFRQQVCELVFCVNILDLDFWWSKLILSDNSVGSGHVFHRKISALK